jgi:hypothetical protein
MKDIDVQVENGTLTLKGERKFEQEQNCTAPDLLNGRLSLNGAGRNCEPRPSSLDELKDNWYINCKGTFDGVKLFASACRFRESK